MARNDPPTPVLRGAPTFGVAAAGLLLGHALAYALAVPDPYHRDLLLRETGHAYLRPAGQAALILLLAGIATLVARACSRRTGEDPGGFGAIATRVAAIQLGAFLGQEVLERVLTGAPLGGLVHDHVLVIGMGAQLLLAVVGAAVLWWLARTSAWALDVLAAEASAPPVGGILAIGDGGRLLPARIGRSSQSVRAPPLPGHLPR
jgi:hypothetical protein